MPWPSFFNPLTLVKPAAVIRRVAWFIVKLLRPGTGAAAVRLVVFRVWTELGLGELVCGDVLTDADGVCAPLDGVAAAAGAGGGVVGGVMAGVGLGVVDGVVVACAMAAMGAKAVPLAKSSAAAVIDNLISKSFYRLWASRQNGARHRAFPPPFDLLGVRTTSLRSAPWP